MGAMERVGLQLRMGRSLGLPGPEIPRDLPPRRGGLSRWELAGHLTELSGQGNLAALTWACGVVLDAQQEGETVAWISTRESSLYPPDAAEAGIDLAALAVVRCPDVRTVARAADRLARSGAFGLLVLDLGAGGDVPVPLQSRLAGLARRHDTAILLLTEKGDDAPSVGSLVALRGRVERRRTPDGQFSCAFHAVKDKRRGPGWGREAACHGLAGLR
jgi:recombination protein RecA